MIHLIWAIHHLPTNLIISKAQPVSFRRKGDPRDRDEKESVARAADCGWREDAQRGITTTPFRELLNNYSFPSFLGQMAP